MKYYRCIKGFSVETCDGDGFHTGECTIIEKGSKWELVEDENRIIGGEIRLENDENWIEISKEDLKKDFEGIMTVYKVRFEGDWCAFDTLKNAIDMFLSEIEEQVSSEELISIKSNLDKLNKSKNITCNYLHEETDYSLYTDTMTLKEFEELPEFEGFC